MNVLIGFLRALWTLIVGAAADALKCLTCSSARQGSRQSR